MPTLTFDGQSFLLDGRRFWMLGAGVQYARVPATSWPRIIAAARQAGFNTIATSCPWVVHEPRRDRFCFDGHADVKQFVRRCAEQDMKVVLRVGPYVDAGFDGGGLPAWLLQSPGLVVREGNERFLERVNTYFQKLLAELVDLQVSQDGPIIAVQVEHDWHCANDAEAGRYLRELTRSVRENGLTVPLLNANDLWQDVPGTIDTWAGWDDLLEHMRQIRTIQPDQPVIVSGFDPADTVCWGQKPPPPGEAKSAGQVQYRLAQVLAGGGQPIVSPFHGGSNFGCAGGRLAGRPDAFITQAASHAAPLGEGGGRSEKYNAVRRLMMFANHFGHVFADLDVTDHCTTVAIDHLNREGGSASAGARRAKSGAGGEPPAVSVVPLAGDQGRAIFVFAAEHARDVSAMLLLSNGTKLPVHLGDQAVGWYLLDVDLRGAGRLDYTNLCPFAIINRSILVVYGPAKSPAYVSVDGTPITTRVPGGQKPLVTESRDLTVVICNEQQIDAAYTDGKVLYVGAAGLDVDGAPVAHPEFSRATIIERGGAVSQRSLSASAGSKPGASQPAKVSLSRWQGASARPYVDGTAHRYASLDGPQTLAACGAAVGYGWYRLKIKSSSTRKRIVHWPESGDRTHLFLDGKRERIHGVGPGADHKPFELRLPKGETTITALVDNLGRFSDGNDLDDRKGLYGHLYEVKPMPRVKPKIDNAAPVHPFDVRGYLAGRTFGQLSDAKQVIWQFTHAKVAPLLLDIDGADLSGTVVLNDQPIAYYAGRTGAALMRLMLHPKLTEPFKRGKNELRFAPDPNQDAGLDQFIKSATLYECVETLSDNASWSFAKWEPPLAKAWQDVPRNSARSLRGVPAWWRTRFTIPEGQTGPWWLDTAGLSKGQILLNGYHLGRYFTATATGKAVGPQTRLHVPFDWLNAGGENEVLIFDEHGFDPYRTKMVVSSLGDLDRV